MSDDYHIFGKKTQRKSLSTKIEKFDELFHRFYSKFRMSHHPNFSRQLCDPYAFFLMCEDVKKYDFNSEDHYERCREVLQNRSSQALDMKYFGAFPFRNLLNLIYRGYLFDYDHAVKIYNKQHNALHIFKQIMDGPGYIMNRMDYESKKVQAIRAKASESLLSLDSDASINLPNINRVCDGMSWPCIINKGFLTPKLVTADIGGFGEGLFIINEEEKIIDVLKINDFWLTNKPLDNRLKFASECRDYEVDKYLKSYSLRSAFKAGQILKSNNGLGISVRPSYEDFYDTTWFNWSKNSLVYCCKFEDGLKARRGISQEPRFYTLEGEEGLVNINEERVNERIWLDDFDIKEFQMVLEL